MCLGSFLRAATVRLIFLHFLKTFLIYIHEVVSFQAFELTRLESLVGFYVVTI